MCNLHSQTTSLDAMRRLFKVDRVGSSAANLPIQPAIFPTYDGPVIRLYDGECELTMLRCGRHRANDMNGEHRACLTDRGRWARSYEMPRVWRTGNR
jgi:hypothetical protein